MSIGLADWSAILPALCVLAASIVVVGVDLFLSRDANRRVLDGISLVGVGGALALLVSHVMSGTDPIHAFYNSVVLDNLSVTLSIAVCLATGMLLSVTAPDIRARGVDFGEYYGLLLMAAASMMLLVAANDFVMLFLTIEIMSLAVYVLTGITRKNPRSNEAAVKYLVTGAFATGFLLLGMGYIYGDTGTLNLEAIGAVLENGEGTSFLTVGVGLLMVGLAFKIGAVPFHQWVPDVYEGAPTTITAFMSVAVKTAAFGAILRVLLVALPSYPEVWANLLWGLAILTMVVGNLLALHQQSVKRMLAYSGVAHTGYGLVGLAAMVGADGTFSTEGASAVVFYLLVYTFMTLGAFVFLVYIGHEVSHPDRSTPEWQDAEHFSDLAGLARRRPWAAIAMTVFMLSLGGFPPTAGFFGKFYLFRVAVDQGHIVLAIIGVLASLVSLYYYLRVVVCMFMRESQWQDEKPRLGVGLVVAVAAVATLFFGIQPDVFLDLAMHSVSM